MKHWLGRLRLFATSSPGAGLLILLLAWALLVSAVPAPVQVKPVEVPISPELAYLNSIARSVDRLERTVSQIESLPESRLPRR